MFQANLFFENKKNKIFLPLSVRKNMFQKEIKTEKHNKNNTKQSQRLRYFLSSIQFKKFQSSKKERPKNIKISVSAWTDLSFYTYIKVLAS